MSRQLAVVLAALVCGGCATSGHVVGKTAEGAEIVQIAFPLSNAFLIKSSPPILVDSGSDGDLAALTSVLAEHGTTPSKLGLVVVTHGHADHAGQAAELQRLGAKIMLGGGDVGMAKAGHNDDLRPTNLTADALKAVLPSTYPAFVPDEVVTRAVSLAPYGVSGEVLPMPGHTPGSLVVVLANKSAFVGDQMLGGILGGALCPDVPTEHYFQADLDRNHRNIRALVRLGIETFYLGHGGPVGRDAVMYEFGD